MPLAAAKNKAYIDKPKYASGLVKYKLSFNANITVTTRVSKCAKITIISNR